MEEFRVLGPVELWAGGQRQTLGTAKVRCVLADLLLSRGRPVSTEHLIQHVWDGHPPPSARETLYGYISGLRKRLLIATGYQPIERRGGGGYIIDVSPDSIDYFRFERLIDEARRLFADGDDASALERVTEGLTLWHGEPLTGLEGAWARDTRTALENRREDVVPFRMDLELRLGRHAYVVGELGELVARHPFDERLIRLWMLALRRCGRTAEALEAYSDTRRRLVDVYGHEPGHELIDLHQQILNDDPVLRHGTGPQRRAALDAPNNLAREIDTFTGREDEIRQLMGLLVPEAGPGAPTVTVIAIHGMPGVGKTTLALHLAHRLAEHHPDAQLSLDLYAHAPDRGPASTAETLDTALRRLGVPPPAIPGSLEDRIALWRTQLARRRCVLLLDDAATGSQVRPLLPGSPGSIVLITSRNRLEGLDARPFALDVMSEADAADLFTHTASPDRGLDRDELAVVARLCGHLPLALTLAANRLARRGAWELGDLIATLSGDDRIGAIRAGERTLAREFALSYRELAPPQALAYRRLGLHPGGVFTVPSAAALIGTDPPEAEYAIEELVDRNLLHEVIRGRYRYHDLLRDYARRLAQAEEDKQALGKGLDRLLDHYILSAAAACRLSRPFERHPDVGAGRSSYGSSPDTPEGARAWLRAEYDSMMSAIRLGYEHGSAERATLLARVLWPYLEEAALWSTAAGLYRQAAELLRATAEADALADTLRVLAHALWRLSELDQALTHAKEALELFRANGDKQGEGLVMDRIALVHWGRTDYRTALAYNHGAVEIFQKIGDRHGEATCLMHGAILHSELGDYPQAGTDFEQALHIFRRIGDAHGMKWTLGNLGDLSLRRGDADSALHLYEEAAAAVPELTRHDEAVMLNNVGAVHAHTGRHADALDNYHRALVIHRAVGDRRSETDTLLNIGHVHLATGDYLAALTHYRAAQTTALELADRRLRMRALHGMGETRAACGQYTSALTAFQGCRELAQETRSRYEEALALKGIGEMLLHLQGPEQARTPWRQALRILDGLNATGADELRDRLSRLDQAAFGHE